MVSGYAANWHPLTWLSHMLDCRLHGLDPAGHHLTNLLLHVLNTCVLLLALARMTGSPWQSAFVASVFALHPLHVESAAWVAERKDVLSTFFGLVALAAYVRYVEQPNPRRYAPVFVLFAAGLLAKPMLVTLPFLLLLVDYRLGRHDEAAEAYTRVLERNPDDPRALVNLGVIRSMRGHPQEAIEMCKRALRVQPDYAAGHYNLAVTYFTMGRFQEAVGAYAEALRIKPSDPEMRTNLGIALSRLGRVDDAIRQYTEALRRRPDHAPAHVQLCGAYGIVGRHQDAREACRSALKIEPDSAEARHNLGVACFSLGRYQEAVEAYRETLRINPGYAEAHRNLGAAYFKLARFEDAAAAYGRAVRLRPDGAESHVGLGGALARLGRVDEAVAHYSAALRLKPDQVDALNNLAWMRATSPNSRIRNGPEAVRLATLACERTAYKNATLLDTLSAAYAESGKFADAVRTATRGLELARTSGQAETAAEIGQRLELYRAGRGFRDAPAGRR
jgi:tetratricopeptide (TPR) repeat protein